jgi:hypothetical protein
VVKAAGGIKPGVQQCRGRLTAQGNIPVAITGRDTTADA